MSDEQKNENLWQFPCDFPIKVMADNVPGIELFVRETLSKHIREPEKIEFKSRESREGNYISMTAIFEADSKEQLNTLYEIFSKHPQVKMVL